MTNYDTLPAGREMDALVAEKVMGWKRVENYSIGTTPDIVCAEVWKTPDGNWYPTAWVSQPPNWSISIRAAWQIIEHLVNSGYRPALIYDDNGHWALVTDGMQNVLLDDKPGDVATMFFIEAKDWFDTAPLAICRAALKAVRK